MYRNRCGAQIRICTNQNTLLASAAALSVANRSLGEIVDRMEEAKMRYAYAIHPIDGE